MLAVDEYMFQGFLSGAPQNKSASRKSSVRIRTRANFPSKETGNLLLFGFEPRAYGIDGL